MTSDNVEVLHGGVANADAVVRVGRYVLRPTNPHSATIHRLMVHMRASGFGGIPDVVGIESDGRERLTFVPGDVPLSPFPEWSLTDDVLASTTGLLKRFHDATAGFRRTDGDTWSREMADPHAGAPDDVVCHNDVCPENVVYRNGVAIAILDLDFAAPGRRIYDVAAFARMCVPVDGPAGAALSGRAHLDPFNRLRVVADAYGLDHDQRRDLVDVLGDQIGRGGEFVRRRVEAGEQAFIDMWNSMGGAARFDRRQAWFAANRDAALAALNSESGGATSEIRYAMS